MNRSFMALLLVLSGSLVSCAPDGRAPTAEPLSSLSFPSDAVRTGAAGVSVHSTPIEHIVIVMQENRSFDNLFQGFPGANTASSGKNSKGQTITLQPVPLEAFYNINHDSSTFFAACDGNPPGRNCKMDGFDLEGTTGSPPPNPQYGYVPRAESKLYFQMAHQYVLADDMFTSHIDASFVSHQYIIAGQANHAVDLPNGPWGCSGGSGVMVATLRRDRSYGPKEGVCFTSPTLADELDAKGLPWRFYAMPSSDNGFIWSAYQASSRIYNGPEWSANVISPSTQFLTDVAAGKLADVTWITPSFANSDHASAGSKTGPDWVASIVNAVGESKFWNSSAIFVLWDEWGGWYDHVPPPYVDYDGLGIRVPLLVISPYAKAGYVSHVQYEHGSVLRFIEDRFGLARLAASDTRANSPAADCFDFTQPPRTFTPFKVKHFARSFLDAPPDTRPLDEE